MNSMKTTNAGTNQPSKQRNARFWIGCFTLLLGLPLLLYYGYCWGLWGPSSLLLQYLFQCGCPVASNEARYPEQVDVIVPACRYVSSVLSPSGRFLYVRGKMFWRTSTYLMNLQNMERVDVTTQPFSSFLTDDLWFAESGLEDGIIDRKTGMKYPTQPFRYWRENAYINGEPNLDLLVSALHQAEQVFFTPNYSTVVVLLPNFLTNPEQSFAFDNSDFPEWGPGRVEQFLRENNIVYQTILEDFPGEAISPDGKLIAGNDGIYLVETGQKIVQGYSAGWPFHSYTEKNFRVRGWLYDGSGVIYSKFLGACLIRLGLPYGDGPACFIWVSQPVLKLKVPEEYILPAQTP